MFLAFSVGRRPATGELMVETQANSPFERAIVPGGCNSAIHLRQGNFAGLAFKIVQVELKIKSFVIVFYYRMLLLFERLHYVKHRHVRVLIFYWWIR